MLYLSKHQLHHLKSIKIQFFPCSNHVKHFVSGFSAASVKQDQPIKPQLIVEYLINSCALSLKEANKASKSISHIKSFSNPDVVINFLKHKGFSDPDIKRIVAAEPLFLCSNVEKNLELKFKAFERIGLSEPEVVDLITANPRFFQCGDVYQKLQFFKELVGSNQAMLSVCKRMKRTIRCSLQKTFFPIVSLLRECGVPGRQIATIFCFHPSIVSCPINSLKESIQLSNDFGIPCESGMFIYLLCSLSLNTREDLNAKIEILKSFGWSEEEVFSAIRKAPQILRFNEDGLVKRMGSILKETACEPSYVARYPMLLGYSLKKRIAPRLLVLQKLKQYGLVTPDLYQAVHISDEVFKKKFVLPNLGKIPDLLKMFIAACAGNGHISS